GRRNGRTHPARAAARPFPAHGQPGRSASPRRGVQLRHGQPLVRPGRRPARHGRGHAGGAALLLPGGAGPDPDPPARRAHARVLRLPRPAQRRARPLQGRHPLPSGGRPRRGACAGLADDLEDGDRRHPVRGRQGRHQRPRRPARRVGAADRHALVHRQDREGPGPDARHTGARRQHQRPRDGVDDGRVRQAPRPHAGDRHRQADRPRRLLRARGGDRPRRRADVHRGRAGARAAAGGHARRDPGLRQRRLLGGAHHRRPGLSHRGRLRRAWRHPFRRGHRRARAARVRLRRRPRARLPRRRRRLGRRAHRHRMRGVHPRRAGRADQRGQRRVDALPDPHRGRQLADDPRGRRDPPRRRGDGRSRRPGQRGRRRRLLLRVGAEPAALPLGGGGGQRPAAHDHERRLSRGDRACRARRDLAARGGIRDRHRARGGGVARPRLHAV
ncbi:MAG: NAD-specific glutamate dehydrogenase; NADP-specific glutamate dehydrogenase, partial [uncultured Solirubrobacteraceae bacterium]